MPDILVDKAHPRSITRTLYTRACARPTPHTVERPMNLDAVYLKDFNTGPGCAIMQVTHLARPRTDGVGGGLVDPSLTGGGLVDPSSRCCKQ